MRAWYITNFKIEEGRPDFSKWRYQDDKIDILKFKPGELNGSRNDFNKIYNKVKETKGFKYQKDAIDWMSSKGLTGHHKSATEIELVPTKLHQNVPHIGSASDMRKGFQ